MRRMSVIVLLMFVLVGVPRLDLLESVTATLVVDPGVRGGPAGAGGPIAGLTADELQLWRDGRDAFDEVEGPEDGLGPRFNGTSCVECHSQPARGGTSPAVNPQVAAATAFGGSNTLPSFVKIDGPAREARFKSDGGVHALFTISGMDGAEACNIQQEDFEREIARGGVSLRIPTPLFGVGLIEAIPDKAIIENKNKNLVLKRILGITGRENREGNAGTITRFGWKAQNKSLSLFSSEAYLVEMGFSNSIFPQERDETPECQVAVVPNDGINPAGLVAGGVFGRVILSDAELFAFFMRTNAAPVPAPDTPSIVNGRQKFIETGCALCHTPTLQTGAHFIAALSNQPVNLYSDLLCHAMGSGLADGITQGNCGVDEFRTAPLFGLGKRIFFLHDGRTQDIVQAIMAHSSGFGVPFGQFNARASEANAVIAKFRSLKVSDQQDLVNFLRSL